MVFAVVGRRAEAPRQAQRASESGALGGLGPESNAGGMGLPLCKEHQPHIPYHTTTIYKHTILWIISWIKGCPFLSLNGENRGIAPS